MLLRRGRLSTKRTPFYDDYVAIYKGNWISGTPGFTLGATSVQHAHVRAMIESSAVSIYLCGHANTIYDVHLVSDIDAGRGP